MLQAGLSGSSAAEVWARKSGLVRIQRTPGTRLEMFHLYSGKDAGYLLPMLWNSLSDAKFTHNEPI